MIDHLMPYAETRDALLTAAIGAGATTTAHRHPSPEPDGELTTDVARFGAAVGEADTVLIVQSGLHGVEGHAGAGLQRRLVDTGRLGSLRAGLAVLLVHGVNPYGMAWSRRVDHDNIDVNRNFVDFDHLPENPGYADVDPLLNPTDPTFDPADQAFLGPLGEMWERLGEIQMMKTLNGGQYTHPAGVQFGGQHASWSRRTLEAIWAEHLAGAARAVCLDVHTGLGPCGRLTVFQTADDHEVAAELGHRLYPDHLFRAPRTTDEPFDHGLLGPGLDAWAGARLETATFVVEFGTLDPISGLTAFRADNWVHHHGDPLDPTGQRVAQLMRDQFFVDDDGWRRDVAEQGDAAIHAALDELS